MAKIGNSDGIRRLDSVGVVPWGRDLKKVSDNNIWRRFFELILLERNVISFTDACPYSPREGAHKFLITVYCSPIYPKNTQ